MGLLLPAALGNCPATGGKVGEMKVYTTRSRGEREGERIEAAVIAGDGGYRVEEFRFVGDAPSAGGWALMPRTYKTLARLLAAVERAGYYVDSRSAGIQ